MENNDPFRVLEEENDKESHLIENLEKKLYSREDEIERKDRTVLRPKKFSPTEQWQGSLGYEKSEIKSGPSPFVRFFLFSLFFFVIAAGIAGYSLFSKRIVVSPDNVNFSLFAPVSAKGGEAVAVQASIDNKNTVGLTKIQITADFPDGARNINNPAAVLEHTIKNLDDMDAGELRTDTVNAILLGQENDRKEITITIRFSIEGSAAQYTKIKKVSIGLTSSPLSVTASVLKETTSGQNMTVTADVTSNSPTLLPGAIFTVDYPKGFVFKSADPSPSFGNNVWQLGDMNLGDVQHIVIQGSVLGQSDEQKVFHLSTGVNSKNDRFAIATVFGTQTANITVKKPFLGVDIFVNGSNSDAPVINDWKNTQIGIQWTNSLSNRVVDGEIQVTLDGDIVNQKSVNPESNGLYDSFKNTIFWDKRVMSSLSSLAPGEKGAVSFTLSLNPFSATNLYKNPAITVTTSVKGKRIDENNVPQEINFFSTKIIKISTSPTILAYGMYNDSPIANSGPLPPVVGKETTYTVTWKVSNTVNAVSGAEATAIIPLSVRFTGKVFPSGAPLSYDATSNKVTWKIGKIAAGTGFSGDPDQVSFQVALVPGLTQRQKTPEIVSRANLTATDVFTGSDVSSLSSSVTTLITEYDLKVTQEQTIVSDQ